MPPSLFLQNVIAIVWDFDKTLTPGYMQAPLFARYGVDERTFWREVNALPDYYRKRGLELVSNESQYLDHLITYAQDGTFHDLTNAVLRELGSEIVFYDGLPDFLGQLRARLADHPGAQQHDIQLEHYVVSTGLRQMILGSAIAEYINGVWACEFVEGVAPAHFDLEATPMPNTGLITKVGYAIDNTTKTRAVFEINKGTNVHPGIDVNAAMALEDRRVPFQNMIYVADGPSDVPVFSVVKSQGGRTFGVYKPGDEAELRQTRGLLRDGRIDAFGEADYRPASTTSMWLGQAVGEIADRITADRAQILASTVSRAPGHIV